MSDDITATRLEAARELLRHHAEQQRRMDRARDVVIEASRNAGLPWTTIGADLGVSFEGLRIKYRDRFGRGE